jgi:CheY-like chemotaxis protein
MVPYLLIMVGMASILLVEDDADSARPLALFLRKASHQVEIAVNGELALAVIFGGYKPDVILLDLQMPVMDGLSFLDNLRSSPQFSRLPVIVISALTPEALQELHAYHVTAALTKGNVDFQLLGQYLERLDKSRNSIVPTA